MTEEDLIRIEKLMQQRDLLSVLRYFNTKQDDNYKQVLLDLADEVPLLVSAVEALMEAQSGAKEQ